MSETDEQEGPQDEGFRDLGRKQPPAAPPAPKGRQYIAVIGIDDYQSWPRLGNAVNDARGVLDLFERELFFERAAEPLFNENATRDNITDLIFNRLSQTLGENDALVLFYAGHGHSETRDVAGAKVESGYLVPWEARADKRSEFINVDELLSELNLLPVRHLLFIVDACHSGIAMGQNVRTFRSGTVRYTDELASLRSRKIISSARRDQLALDGGPVPGHSLFTSHLIHGLRTAEADTDNNDYVSGRELGLYLQQKVAQAAWDAKKESRQTPDFGEFGLDDRGDLVISLKREQVESHLAAGRMMRVLGERMNDWGRLDSAILYLDRAIRLSPTPHAGALFERGRAYFAVEDYDAASKDLFEARKLNPESLDTLFYLGLNEALRDDAGSAISVLREFLALAPSEPRADWVRQFLGTIDIPANATRHALLIGVGRYASSSFTPLEGPANDVALLRSLLVETGQFEAANITTLLDEQANRDGILAEFDRLTKQVGPHDTIFVHFSGHAASGDEPGYLAPYDAAVGTPPPGVETAEAYYQRLITEDELDKFMTGLSAINRVLILDTHVTNRFEAMASRQEAYTVVMATQPRIWARETWVDTGLVVPAGDDPENSLARLQSQKDAPPAKYVAYGAFTHALVTALRSQPDAPLDVVMTAVTDQLMQMSENEQEQQIPSYYGMLTRSFWQQRRPRNLAPLSDIDLAALRRFDAVSNETLMDVVARLRQGSPMLPDVRTSVGTALVGRGRHRVAVEVLAGDGASMTTEAACALATAFVRTGQYEQAASVLHTQKTADADVAARLDPILAVLDGLRSSQGHALLVGVDVPPVATGTGADVIAMRQALLEAGLADENIKVLANAAATADAIRAGFEELARQAKDEPAMFYFAGPGNMIDMRTPGITPSAGPGIPLDWFLTAAGEDPTNLISIFDAGWKDARLPWGPTPGSRYAQARATPRDIVFPQSGVGGLGSPATNRIEAAQQREVIQPLLEESRVGRATILHISIRQTLRRAIADLPGEDAVESDFLMDDGTTQRRGVLTHALIDALRHTQGMRLVRLRELQNDLRERMGWLEPFILYDNPDEPVLANAVKENMISYDLYRLAYHLPIEAAIAALTKLSQDVRSEDSRVHLDLAVAYAAMDDYESSTASLDAARRTAPGDDPAIDYELGRILFESGIDYDAAVSNLHRAVAGAPDLPDAHYYLGAAIRARVEGQAYELIRAEDAFSRYLQLGAPLGHVEEVESFLASRRNARDRESV